MDRRTKMGLTAAALMACASGAASAGTIVAGTQTSSGTKNFSATQTFPAFGSIVGTDGVPSNAVLTSVHDTVTDILTGAVSGHNTGTGAGSYSVHAEDKASKLIAGVLTVNTTTIGGLVAGTLAGGASFGPTPSSGSNSSSFSSTNATVLAAFAGTGTVSAAVKDLITTAGSFSFSGRITSVGKGVVQDVLSYDYTVPVPAPLIGSGLPVVLAAGGVLFGAKLVADSKKRRSPGTAIPHAAA